MSLAKKYKIARHGKELGSLSLTEIANALKSGHVKETDDCWTEGDSKWGKLSDITNKLSTSSTNNSSPISANFSKPMQNQSNPLVITSNKNHSWALVALFITALCILITLLFINFRTNKWDYHTKVVNFPDAEYINSLKGPIQWKYTYSSVPARSARYTSLDADRTGHDAMSATQIDREILKSLTEEMTNSGWEFAGTAMEIETAYPNFGKDEYVTGLRENIRPQALLIVFRKAIQLDHTRMGVGLNKQNELISEYTSQMGTEGWELVSSVKESNEAIVLTFKRPKR
jgi:hypothetical protein